MNTDRVGRLCRAGGIAAVVVAICFLSCSLILLSRPDPCILDKCYKLDWRVDRELLGVPYFWLSAEEVIEMHHDQGDVWNIYFYDLRDHSKRALENVNRFISAALDRKWVPHVKSPWIELDFATETNTWVYFSNFAGSQSETNVLDGQFQGRAFWMPNQLAILRVLGQRTRFERGIKSAIRPLQPAFSPENPIGFNDNNLFLYATNSLSVQRGGGKASYPSILSLEFWDLKGVTSRVLSRSVRFGGDQIVQGVISPSGRRIVWICYHQSYQPRVFFSADFPFIKVDRPYSSIRFYLTTGMAEDAKYLGAIPSTIPFPYVQWVPGDEQISIEYEGKLYLFRLAGF